MNGQREIPYVRNAIEIAVRLGLLAALLYWCLTILKPFIPLLIWGIIIAITLFPIFNTVNKRIKRGGLTATLIVVFLLTVIIVPCVLLAGSLLDGITRLRESYQHDGILIPPPGESVQSWPVITKPVVDLWKLASSSTQVFVTQYREQLQDVAKWIFRALTGIGIGILEMIVAIILSGVMLAYAKSGGEAAERVFIRLVGKRGLEFVRLTETTIRQVVKGILGVAVIQTILASLGLFIAGVPLAGLWAVLCLILAIIQVGVGPVIIPVVIYVWSTSTTTTAVLFTIWNIIVLTIDNVLKPLLLGKGAPVPMLIIFLGAIGGFVATGLVGLFLGAVILSLTYKLLLEWLAVDEPSADDASAQPSSEDSP